LHCIVTKGTGDARLDVREHDVGIGRQSVLDDYCVVRQHGLLVFRRPVGRFARRIA